MGNKKRQSPSEEPAEPVVCRVGAEPLYKGIVFGQGPLPRARPRPVPKTPPRSATDSP